MENLPESETRFDVFVSTCDIGGVDVGDLRERMEDYVGRVKEMKILDEKAVEKEREESILCADFSGVNLSQLGLFLCSSGLPAIADVAAAIKAEIWIRMMINNLMSNTQPPFIGMFTHRSSWQTFVVSYIPKKLLKLKAIYNLFSPRGLQVEKTSNVSNIQCLEVDSNCGQQTRFV
ncbi:unnamed protein product [Lactuca virosa]|uniref:Uncharacterized protein n=1 Tax=Lactuca virosa TaxID=75947 RepID=A0AAU9NY49_9ASTR|nr:unnamed protein product [Lactuca virosa]